LGHASDRSSPENTALAPATISALAREAGLTRARVTQLLSLIDLPARERAALRGGEVDVSVNEALRRAGGRRG
jgi:glycerate-2-kinase